MLWRCIVGNLGSRDCGAWSIRGTTSLSLCCINFDHSFLICLMFAPSREVQHLISCYSCDVQHVQQSWQARNWKIRFQMHHSELLWCPYYPTRDYKKATYSECNQAWYNFSRPIRKPLNPYCILIIKTNNVGSMCESGYWFRKVNNSLTKLKYNLIQQQKSEDSVPA